MNKDKCLFRCTLVPLFDEIISRQDMRLYLRKLKALTDMPPLKSKKELQAFLGIINYVSKWYLIRAEVCEQLRWLTSVKKEWT